MYDLEKGIRQELRDEADELFAEQYPDDRITEMVDGSVPVYTSTLMAIAAADPYLATEVPEILAFDGTPTPVNAVAGNVYQRLMAAAQEEWKAMTDEADNCDNCGNYTLDPVLVNIEPANYGMRDPYPGYAGDPICRECAGDPDA
jgi:hypothetical protein